MTEIRGALRGQNLPEGCLYFFGLLQAVHQTEPVGEANTVGVDDNGAGDTEDISEDERIARDMMAANGNSVDYMA